MSRLYRLNTYALNCKRLLTNQTLRFAFNNINLLVNETVTLKSMQTLEQFLNTQQVSIFPFVYEYHAALYYFLLLNLIL